MQHFSVRDATARLGIASSTRLGVAPTMGRLGGPNYPADPNDLGPLVPLPGGFAEVFEYLASVGVAGFEFFQSTQNVNELGRQPTAAEIRSYLDNAGLRAQGSHQFGPGNLDVATGNLIAADPAASPTAPGENLFSFLQTLGMNDDGLLGQPLQSEHARQLRQPGHRRDHVRVRRPRGACRPDRRDPDETATSSTSSTRSRTTTASSPTPPTPSWTPCIGSSG